MKLDKNSVFNRASIVIIHNNKLYYNEASYLLSCNEWPDCLETDDLNDWGVLVYNSEDIDINGTIAFWVEDDEATPILKVEDMYYIEPDYVYDDFKTVGVITAEQSRLIKEGFDFLNIVVIEGGKIDF